jgi:hypothetical protein
LQNRSNITSSATIYITNATIQKHQYDGDSAIAVALSARDLAKKADPFTRKRLLPQRQKNGADDPQAAEAWRRGGLGDAADGRRPQSNPG